MTFFVVRQHKQSEYLVWSCLAMDHSCSAVWYVANSGQTGGGNRGRQSGATCRDLTVQNNRCRKCTAKKKVFICKCHDQESKEVNTDVCVEVMDVLIGIMTYKHGKITTLFYIYIYTSNCVKLIP
jgi:hypothetical protein